MSLEEIELSKQQSMTGSWYSVVDHHEASAGFKQTGDAVTGSIDWPSKAFSVNYKVTGTITYPTFVLHGTRSGDNALLPATTTITGSIGSDQDLPGITIDDFPITGGFTMIPDGTGPGAVP